MRGNGAAKRRGTATTATTASFAAASWDRPLAAGLILLALFYTSVTVVTYVRVADVDEQRRDEELYATTAALTGGGVGGGNGAALRENDPIYALQHAFPIHVGDDVEVIPHPALALMEKKQLQNFPAAKEMRVPKFFDESHGAAYGTTTIRHYLGDGETLMTPEQAASIGSVVNVTGDNNNNNGSNEQLVLETIYCSIASYRDPECTGTVEDLYARAKHPERIRVAITDQRLPGSDDPVCSRPAKPCSEDPDQALCRYRHLIDAYEMDARQAVGPVFARHLGHRHYRGEYFAMQIDSHVRFTEHWDADIIEQWQSAHNEMAVLSTYLSDIIGSIDPVTHKNIHRGRPIMCVSDYEGSGAYKHLRHGQQPEGPPGIHGQPTLHPFWAAGFSFARGHFVIQVPYDQYLPMVFQGEEISVGLRGFTYGYDYYAAERSVCFHMYAIKENKEKRKKVPLFWENGGTYTGVGVKAMKRLNSIIGMREHPANEWQHAERHKYGLGKVRTTEKFFKTFGIHTQNQTVEHHLCRFVGKPMMRVFLPHLRDNHMGINYDEIDYEFVDPAPDEDKKEKEEAPEQKKQIQ